MTSRANVNTETGLTRCRLFASLSDGMQSLTPEHYRTVMNGVTKLAAFMRDEHLIGLEE